MGGPFATSIWELNFAPHRGRKSLDSYPAQFRPSSPWPTRLPRLARITLLVVLFAAALALGPMLGSSTRTFGEISDSPTHELTGKILSVERIQRARRVDIATLTGYVVGVQYTAGAADSSDIQSFTLVEENGDVHTIFVMNPNPGITNTILHAMQHECSVQIQVVRVGGDEYLYGDETSIQLICP